MLSILFNLVLILKQNPVTVIFASLLIYFIFIWESRAKKILNKFPGPPTVPLMGNVHSIMNPENIVPIGLKWSKLYGPRFRGFIGPQLGGLVASSPNDVEKVLTSTTIIDKSVIYMLVHPWLGDGLLLSTGKKWHARRKALTPAFHFKILDNFLPIMNQQAKIFVEILKEKREREIEIHSYVTLCALDIICETAMGKTLNCQRERENAYAMATLKESGYFWYRATRPWLYLSWTWSMSKVGREEKKNLKVLHDFTDKVIQERKENFLKENNLNVETEVEDEGLYFSTKSKFAFLDLLIREQAKGDTIQLTDQDIRDEVDTFMFEGHDTTAAAMTWTIFLLGLYPEYQAKVHEELDSIFGTDRDGDMTTGDLSKLKYLECCIKESLRLYPSVPIFGRQLYQDFAFDDGSVVPDGTTLLVIPYLVHRNPEIFPNPEEFQPSRFFPEIAAGRHPYAYIPFSAGPRNCIGQRFAYMEQKVILGNLFRNFTVTSLDTRDSVTPLMEVVMRPKNGIRVTLTRR